MMQKTFLFLIVLFLLFQSPIKNGYEEYFTYASVNFIIPEIFSDKMETIEKGQIILVKKHQNNFSGKVSAIFDGKLGSIEIPSHIELFKNRKKYEIGESYAVSDVKGAIICYDYDQNLVCKRRSGHIIPYGESLKILKVQYLKAGSLLTIDYKDQRGLIIHSSINTLSNLKSLHNEKFTSSFKSICSKYYDYAKSQRYTCLSENISSNGDAGESWKERDEFSIIYYNYLAVLIGRKYKDIFGRLLRLDIVNEKSYVLTIEDMETFEERRIPLIFDFNNQAIYSIKVADTEEKYTEANERYKGKLKQFIK